MSVHTGFGGIVKVNGTAVSELQEWSIDETANTTPMTAAGRDHTLRGVGPKDWTGSASFLADDDDAGQALLRAGASIDIECYSDGDSAGKTFYSGPAVLQSVGAGSPHDGQVTRTVSFEGNGPLTIAAVT